MNITILANQDIYSNLAINRLLPYLQSHDVSLFLSSTVGEKSTRPNALRDLKFFEQTLFNHILFPVLDSQSFVSRKAYKRFSELAYSLQHPILPLNQINHGQDFDTFCSTQPDLVLSIRYGVILKKQVISIPKYGVLNLHSGHLPSYRGVMATFRAMLNGDTLAGTTLHYIDDENIDTGGIIARTESVLNYEKSYLWNVLQLYPPACELVAKVIKEIEQEGTAGNDEQNSGGEYYSFPTEQDITEFQSKGCRLFDGEEMPELCRAFLD